MQKRQSTDAHVIGGGTVYLLRPTSGAALDWLAENVSEDAIWFAGGLAVEHRHIAPLVVGMREAGLVVVAA